MSLRAQDVRHGAAATKRMATSRPKGLGFRVWGLGFGVWGLGFRATGPQSNQEMRRVPLLGCSRNKGLLWVLDVHKKSSWRFGGAGGGGGGGLFLRAFSPKRFRAKVCGLGLGFGV